MVSFPETSAGRQLFWYLGRIAAAGTTTSPDDPQHFAPECTYGRWIPNNADMRGAWKRLAGQMGAFEIASVDEASDTSITATVNASGDKRWQVTLQVEDGPAHRITALDWRRIFEFEVTVREATEADATVLSDIERRCPVVLGDKSVAFDRSDDYFAFARLMEDVTVALGFVGGDPAAINCGAVHLVRIDGVERRLMTAIHTRILPEHQRKGLWGAVSRVLGEKYPPLSIDGSHGYVSVDNAAMQKGLENTPNRWDVRAVRCLLRCSAVAGPPSGRPATLSDAARVVEMLNACHADEELYLPYTVESLTERLARAPTQYSWERLWVTEGAVVGVWPAESIRLQIASNGTQTESRRGLVLDYGFLPGAEDQFEQLLRFWCAWLANQGLDTLSIFTSERSRGYELLRCLATEIEEFDMWTPGLEPPPGAADRPLYTDQVYF